MEKNKKINNNNMNGNSNDNGNIGGTLLYFIIFVVICAVVYVLYKLFFGLTDIRVDNKYTKLGNNKSYPHSFEVNDDLPCPPCAANLLAEINSRNQKLIKYLTKKYLNKNTHGNLNKNELFIKKVIDRYIPGNVVETTPDGGRNTSYTINKGQIISLCIRDDKTKELHDINLLMYVDIHELGHLAVDSWGHGAEFQEAFAFLLRNAVEAGIWIPTNYSITPKPYCGITVNKTISY